MNRAILMGITIFALAGLIVPMTIQTSYGNHPECDRGDVAPAELKPRVDINGNGFICVLKQIDTPHGTVVIAIDDNVDTSVCHITPCPSL